MEITENTFFASLDAELQLILQWWIEHMPDEQNGGFYGRMDAYGQVHPESEKGVVLCSRILWTFSTAAQHHNTPAYKAMAQRAYDYLLQYFWDPQYGGVYWSVDYQGQAQQTKKQVYAQAFALYGFCAYYQMSGDAESLQKALSLFEIIEKYAFDPIKNGYWEAFSKDWQLLDDLRLSDKDANEAKTQNTHLHLLEAYTLLVETLQKNTPLHPGLAAVRGQLNNLVHLFLYHFIDQKTGHLHLFFNENWVLKSHTVSYGHDIEASWLLFKAVKVLDNQVLTEKVKPVCLQMAAAVLQNAVQADGSVANEYDRRTGQIDTDRIWWVQAEAMVGFWNAYQLSALPVYKHAAINCWAYTRASIRDTRQGEWYWRKMADGRPLETDDKAGFWKCPYHNGRAMMLVQIL